MPREPSLNQLRAFLHVAQSVNFSEAARNLNLSQPALSRTIQMLESNFGLKLFDRDTRNVALTPAGRALLPVASRLVGDFDLAFVELGRTFAGERGQVVVGAMPSLAANLLPPIVAGFQQSHPSVNIIVRDTLSGSIEEQFKQSHIDLALIAPLRKSEAYHFTPVMDDEFGLVTRHDGAGAAAGPATWQDLRDRPFIAMARESSVRFFADRGFSLAGVSAHLRYECAHLTTVGGLIEAGLGISALPKSTIALLGSSRIVWRRLEGPVVARTIGLARVAHRALSPAAEMFAKAVLAHIENEVNRAGGE